ncbi:ACT domain-containing protein [Vibrio agarivorans]|uniref:ACT domain-containing protein n=1 Tax=Vibrio agarivorans TaxID=153622 RepID=A0ABT7Y3U0_9VIBR|nr:ACT domain-containing protein [Vibrio agarivorans]MDN2482658.1 ACT domain-containing protein [Vibrio agarivorans]
MKGISDLETLLKSMSPELLDENYVFCTLDNTLAAIAELEPIATFREQEGLTLVLPQQTAEKANLVFDGVYSCITLTVHSSLDAVGLTAAVATKLAEHGISANVIAAYYHDHIFVQQEKAQAAMQALAEFSN